MPLELHVWGPAFGLPSIDAECLATIAYFQTALEDRPSFEWSLIVAHDPSISPTKDFPLLIDGATYVAGFDRIVEHLRSRHDVNLETTLSPIQRADSIAISALLRSRALPLLDLSLYTSFANNYHNTRPAFTALLPWHANYVVPPSRRAVALARTERLGLGSLSDSDMHTSTGVGTSGVSANVDAAKRAAGVGKGESGPGHTSSEGFGRSTLSRILRSPEHASRFKLDGLCADMFEPLEELLNGEDYLLGSKRPTSVDCVALGYLALMFYPTLKQPWLAQTITAKFKTVEKYTRRLKERMLGDDVDVKDVLSLKSSIGGPRLKSDNQRSKGQLTLPWVPPPQDSLTRPAISIGAKLMDLIPGISSLHYEPSSSNANGASVRTLSLQNAMGMSTILGGLLLYYLQPTFGAKEQILGYDPRARAASRTPGLGGADSFFTRLRENVRRSQETSV